MCDDVMSIFINKVCVACQYSLCFPLYIGSLFTIYDVMSIFINKVCVVCQYSLYIKYIGSLLTIYDVMSIFFNNEY